MKQESFKVKLKVMIFFSNQPEFWSKQGTKQKFKHLINISIMPGFFIDKVNF